VWEWTASTTKTPASQTVVPDPQNYTITFMASGTYQAKADCNSSTGTWATTDAGDLQLKAGPSTLVACGEGSLYQAFLSQLSLASRYAITGSQLTITLADEGTMTFRVGQQ